MKLFKKFATAFLAIALMISREVQRPKSFCMEQVLTQVMYQL